MTFRAILIGLLVGVTLAGLGYFNDFMLKQSYVAGDLVPVTVYGLLVVGLLVVNPLLRLAGRRHMSGAEWCTVLVLVLAASMVSGPSVMWYFSTSTAMPRQYYPTEVGWQKMRVFDYLPGERFGTGSILIVDPDAAGTYGPGGRKGPADVAKDFKTGIGQEGLVGFGQIPWAAWRKTLAFYLPFYALLFIGSVCLVLVVHEQWAHRERLRYPVAEFAAELLGGGKDTRSVFRNRMFWLGFLPVFVILFSNGYVAWYDKLGLPIPNVKIPLSVDLSAVLQKWPDLQRAEGIGLLVKPTIYFAAVGLAFFVSTDVSFGLGISGVAWAAVSLVLFKLGIPTGGGNMTGRVQTWQLFGSFLGMGLILLYVGRRYYGSVARRAVFLPTADRVGAGPTWGLRVGLLAAAGMVLMMVFVLHLHWLLAVLTVVLLTLMLLVMTRISAESGMFFIQPHWQPLMVLAGVFGTAALGPNMLLVLAMLSILMALDPRNCLMPVIANALRTGERVNLRPSRMSRWIVVAVLLGLVFGVVFTIYLQYNVGGAHYDWATKGPAKYPFIFLTGELRHMKDLDRPIDPDVWHGFDLSQWNPNHRFLWAAGFGVGLVLLFSALRLRFTWWPIHPVLFLVWGTWAMNNMVASFFLGWFIKVLVTRLGGSRGYRKARTLFVGVIAGEFVAGLAWGVLGLIYYLRHGQAGVKYIVHP